MVGELGLEEVKPRQVLKCQDLYRVFSGVHRGSRVLTGSFKTSPPSGKNGRSFLTPKLSPKNRLPNEGNHIKKAICLVAFDPVEK